MIFLKGPRQAGKTTLAKSIARDFASSVYLNLAKEERIQQIIEVKESDSSLHPGLRYFHEKYGYPAVQLVKELKKEYQVNGIEVRQSLEFLRTLIL